MKSKIMKAVSILPFCVPYPYILLNLDYYYGEEALWVVTAIAVLIGVMASGYALAGKVKEILAGSAVGALVSFIITSIVNNGFDESYFKPLTSVSYVVALAVAVLILQLFGILAAKIIKKIKTK